MSRLSRTEDANRVPRRGAGLAFTLFTLAAVVNNAAIEGISSPMDSIRNVTTIALGGFAIFSFLKTKDGLPQPAPALPLIEHDLASPVREGAVTVPLEDLLWIAQTEQRPITDEVAATRAANAAILSGGLA